jgi:hypothetical protein
VLSILNLPESIQTFHLCMVSDSVRFTLISAKAVFERTKNEDDYEVSPNHRECIPGR